MSLILEALRRADAERERERSTLHSATLLLVEGRLQREGAAVSVLVQGVTVLRHLSPA